VKCSWCCASAAGHTFMPCSAELDHRCHIMFLRAVELQHRPFTILDDTHHTLVKHQLLALSVVSLHVWWRWARSSPRSSAWTWHKQVGMVLCHLTFG
jgi:hypothetical protein